MCKHSLCYAQVILLLYNCVVIVSVVYDYFAVPCRSLSDPTNGVMTCSLGDDGIPSYEDTCSFTCNAGYELIGSDLRNCLSKRIWSGLESLCRIGKMCVSCMHV